MISEVGVNSDSIAFEICYVVTDFESKVAGVSKVFLRDIVWQLRLVEIYLTIVAVPLGKISEVVL